MAHRLGWALGSSGLIVLGIITQAPTPPGAIATQTTPATPAVSPFPEVDADYWATPFIEALAARNIVVGYPDGTYRPEEAVERDEFASMIRSAFSQEPVRQIPAGTAFEDIPPNYWAAEDIEAASEMGFMSGLPGGVFLPRRPVSKVDAVTAIARGLDLSLGEVRPEQLRAAQPPSQPSPQRPRQPISLAAGLWALATGQFRFEPRTAQAAPPAPDTQEPPTPTAAVSPTNLLNQYYTDAAAIPTYARQPVAAATAANIVVNYPQVNAFNPNELVSRGMAAALIHQAMVHQGKLEPLPVSAAATRYIVGRNGSPAVAPQAGE